MSVAPSILTRITAIMQFLVSQEGLFEILASAHVHGHGVAERSVEHFIQTAFGFFGREKIIRIGSDDCLRIILTSHRNSFP